jgi:precorrin-6A synthase
LIYEEMISNELQENQCGAFLAWGDPSLYNSTLRIIDQVTARKSVAFEFEVIPGISSIQALAARHKITLNGIGGSILITTGRRLASGMVKPEDRTIVMLDGQCAFQELLHEGLDIFWAAYLGTDTESLLAGKLSEVADTIEKVRSDSREHNGWIMDTYLLCKENRTNEVRDN